MTVTRPARPVVSLCATAALCCALMSGPAPAEACGLSLVNLITRTIVSVNATRTSWDPSLPVIVTRPYWDPSLPVIVTRPYWDPSLPVIVTLLGLDFFSGEGEADAE